MKHTRVRTDVFETNSSLLRVTGRQGYEKSTDVWITRESKVEFEQKGDDTNDPGFNVIGSDSSYSIPYPLKQLNLTGSVDLQLAPNPICDSMDNVKIKPVGCKSFYDAYPKTQSKLLPYLVPSGTRERISFQTTDHTCDFTKKSETEDLDLVVHWDPRVNGNFVLSTHANGKDVGDPD